MEIAMSELREGERGIVICLALPPERAAAVKRLGLLPGTELLCLRRSPLGDPTAYRFRGTTAALRKRDCQFIHVARR